MAGPELSTAGGFEFQRLTPERWADFEALFGSRGACGGCWCMFWRLQSGDFKRGKGEGNRQAMKALVESGTIPGILAYAEGRAVGWCSVAPRPEFRRFERSRSLKSPDDRPVWSLVCLFVGRLWRRRGLSTALIRAAVEYAVLSGAKIVEAYPSVPYSEKTPDAFLYTGIPSAYERAGFSLAARPSNSRMIMRYVTGS